MNGLFSVSVQKIIFQALACTLLLLLPLLVRAESMAEFVDMQTKQLQNMQKLQDTLTNSGQDGVLGGALESVNFDRLFNSQASRTLLDRLRLQPPKSDEDKQKEEEKPKEKVITGPRFISVTGMILKENGKKIVLLDGNVLPMSKQYNGEGFVAYPEDMSKSGLPVASEDSQDIFLVKPGESMDFVENRVRITYKIDPAQLTTASREPPPTMEGEDGKEATKKNTGAK